MREYCLVDSAGNVINISMKYDGKPPVLNDYQIGMGYSWVPLSKVSMMKLSAYRYWSERP
jgi:hypothetical protein